MRKFFFAFLALLAISCRPDKSCLPVQGLEHVFSRHQVEQWCWAGLIQLDMMVVVDDNMLMDGSFTMEPSLKRIRLDRGDGLIGWFDDGNLYATPFPDDPPLNPETLWMWPLIASAPYIIHTRNTEKPSAGKLSTTMNGIILTDIVFGTQGELLSLRLESDEKKIGKKLMGNIIFDDYREGAEIPFPTRWEIRDQNGELTGRVQLRDWRLIQQDLMPYIFEKPAAVERIN